MRRIYDAKAKGLQAACLSRPARPRRRENGQLWYAAAARSVPLGARLTIEPDVFHAPAVVDAVAHDRQPLDIGLPAVPSRRVVDDRPGAILRQLLLDRPHQGLALVLISLDRLPVDHLVELGIAVSVIISFGAAYVILVQILVGIVDAVAGEHHPDAEILAGEPPEPMP